MSPPRGAYEAALALHRSGQLEQAREAYGRLLAVEGEDPDVLGLLGVVALQQGRPDEAETLLRRALARDGGVRLHLRNLNNLIALFRESGRRQDAWELLSDGVPDWPEGEAPGAAERGTILSLGHALLALGDPEAGLSLIRSAFPEPAGDPEVLALTGRLLLALDHPEAALSRLEHAAESLEGDFDLPVAHYRALTRLKRQDEARKVLRDVARHWRIWSQPDRSPRRKNVLLINWPPRTIGGLPASPAALHFSTNVAAQLSRSMREDMRFHSIFADVAGDGLPAQPPEIDVILNNCVNSETMNVPGQLEQVEAVIRWAGRPVINPPEAVAATTRQKTAELLGGIPGLKVPRIERYRVGVGRAAADAILDDVEGRFGYPVILRTCQGHKSADH